MADRGELMLLAATGVGETAHFPHRDILRCVIVAAQAVGPEKLHDSLPLVSMGADGFTMKFTGNF